MDPEQAETQPISRADYCSEQIDESSAADDHSRHLDKVQDALQNALHEALYETEDTPQSQNRPTKLIIQIPCFNEEQTLAVTLNELPRRVDGVDEVEWLVVDDGSTDRTAEVARESGVDHIVQLPRNQGLAHAFAAGLDACLRHGADIIVNTDADNQYCAADIEQLIQPIVSGDAEFVVGARPIESTPHFSPVKKLLQRLGSQVVRCVSKTDVPDAPSGFRAMTQQTARRLNVFSEYTYTLETIIQAGQKNMAITSVPVRTNADLRPSRLLKSTFHYVMRSALTILRIFMTYRPFQFFAVPGCCVLSLGMIICLRFVYFYFSNGGAGHIQSLILGATLIGIGSTGVVVGLIADLISVNRKLLEQVDWRVQELSATVLDHQKLLADYKPGQHLPVPNQLQPTAAHAETVPHNQIESS